MMTSANKGARYEIPDVGFRIPDSLGVTTYAVQIDHEIQRAAAIRNAKSDILNYLIHAALYSINFFSMISYTFCFRAGRSLLVIPATGMGARNMDLDRPGLRENTLR